MLAKLRLQPSKQVTIITDDLGGAERGQSYQRCQLLVADETTRKFQPHIVQQKLSEGKWLVLSRVFDTLNEVLLHKSVSEPMEKISFIIDGAVNSRHLDI